MGAAAGGGGAAGAGTTLTSGIGGAIGSGTLTGGGGGGVGGFGLGGGALGTTRRLSVPGTVTLCNVGGGGGVATPRLIVFKTTRRLGDSSGLAGTAASTGV